MIGLHVQLVVRGLSAGVSVPKDIRILSCNCDRTTDVTWTYLNLNILGKDFILDIIGLEAGWQLDGAQKSLSLR